MKNKLAIFFISFAIVTSLLLFVYFKKNNWSFFNQTEKNRDNASISELTTNTALQNIKSQTDLSEDLSKYNIAILSKKTQDCLSINNIRTKSLCISSISQSTIDPKSCLQITDKSIFEECNDFSYIETASSSQDITICEKIINSNRQLFCVDFLAKTSATCKKISDTDLKSYCQQRVLYYQALNSPTESSCLKLTDPHDKASCRLKFFKLNPGLDEDNDGVSLYNELLNNTNPHKKDTDGDGFADSVEIESGNLPNQIGKTNLNKDYTIINCFEITGIEFTLELKACMSLPDKLIDLAHCQKYSGTILENFCQKKR